MPEIALPERTLYGRKTFMPDEIIAQAAVGQSRLALALYVRHRPSAAWESASRNDLIADIASAWRR